MVYRYNEITYVVKKSHYISGNQNYNDEKLPKKH